jgi:hypothetical protein
MILCIERVKAVGGVVDVNMEKHVEKVLREQEGYRHRINGITVHSLYIMIGHLIA